MTMSCVLMIGWRCRSLSFVGFLIVPLLLAVPAFRGHQDRKSDETAPRGSVSDIVSLLERFIALSDREELLSAEARTLLTGEAADWETPSFGKLATHPDKTVILDASNAVGRVQWYGANEQVTDFYFYMTLDQGEWKIRAMRHLALTGVVEMVHFALKAKQARSPDEDYQFRNTGLVLASDAKLREWFTANRFALEKLRTDLLSSGRRSVVVSRPGLYPPEPFSALRKLGLTSIELMENGDVDIVIGGITDNAVGFLYCPASPPGISSDSYIWVERIVDRWFLYRTT